MKQIHFASYVNLNKKIFIYHLALPTRWQKEEFIMAKNKEKISTPSEKASNDFNISLDTANEIFESSLSFLNGSNEIKDGISQVNFEKTFKKITELSLDQLEFIEETFARLRKFFSDCMEVAKNDEDYFSLIRDLVNLANEIENSTVIKINLDGWKAFYNDKIYTYITSLETFLSVFVPEIKKQKDAGLYPNPKLTYNHKVLKNFILGGIGYIMISFYDFAIGFIQIKIAEEF